MTHQVFGTPGAPERGAPETQTEQVLNLDQVESLLRNGNGSVRISATDKEEFGKK